MERRPVGNIAPDHLARYEFAAKQVKGRILDAACGVGYGSKILSQAGPVVGVDISEDAISAATVHYPGPEYICGPLEAAPWLLRHSDRTQRANGVGLEVGKIDCIVSFETIEHLEAPDVVLAHFARSLAPGGLLVCSVPNEQFYPFDAARFAGDQYPHRRHYTPEQFGQLLCGAGFDVTQRRFQSSKQDPQIREGTQGKFIIYVCQLLPQRQPDSR